MLDGRHTDAWYDKAEVMGRAVKDAEAVKCLELSPGHAKAIRMREESITKV